MTTQNGIDFTPNIPTEEIFTTPHKDKVDGVIAATKSGVMIEEMSLEFSDGKVVKVTAKKGEDRLRKDIETITGFNQLGEVALVPHSSPISQSGKVFTIILFDENASCHLALGNAYRFAIKGGEKMSDEEFAQAGGNLSQDHWDFMIGSEKMDVDGITQDGSTEPVMRSGEWAFDV